AAPDPRRWRTLILLCLAQFMVILDVSVVNIALPAIGADLALDRAALTWVLTAYTLCFGGLMLLSGRLADLGGRRPTVLTGLVVFTAASLGAGLGMALAALGVAVMSTIAGASVDAAPAAAVLAGFVNAFLACAIAAGVFAPGRGAPAASRPARAGRARHPPAWTPPPAGMV